MTEYGLWQPDTPAAPTTTTIWKIPLGIKDEQWIDVPMGAKALTVQRQGDTACLWVHVNPEAPVTRRPVYVYGTGNPIPDRPRQEYLGTVQDGYFVWHAFWGDY